MLHSTGPDSIPKKQAVKAMVIRQGFIRKFTYKGWCQESCNGQWSLKCHPCRSPHTMARGGYLYKSVLMCKDSCRGASSVMDGIVFVLVNGLHRCSHEVKYLVYFFLAQVTVQWVLLSLPELSVARTLLYCSRPSQQRRQKKKEMETDFFRVPCQAYYILSLIPYLRVG